MTRVYCRNWLDKKLMWSFEGLILWSYREDPGWPLFKGHLRHCSSAISTECDLSSTTFFHNGSGNKITSPENVLELLALYLTDTLYFLGSCSFLLAFQSMQAQIGSSHTLREIPVKSTGNFSLRGSLCLSLLLQILASLTSSHSVLYLMNSMRLLNSTWVSNPWPTISGITCRQKTYVKTGHSSLFFLFSVITVLLSDV